MSKFKSLIMLCISFLMLYCHDTSSKKEKLKREHNIPTEKTNHSNKEQTFDNLTETEDEDDEDYEDENVKEDETSVTESVTTDNPKKHKFKSFMHVINILKNRYKDIKNMVAKIKPWILEHPDKKKELGNAFTTIYKFLDEKRKIHANNKTFNEYITDAINAGHGNHENGKYGASFGQDININFIFDFFTLFKNHLTTFAKDSKSAEEIFEFIKTKLLNTDPDVNRLITKW
ncbi:Mlp family lipoprotein (plasmid) [Borrelia miyamotoi]|nr:Mlp family lipoprotein [Borrelia miyamotoi]WAZ72474.1 Mlp family lipoprotein [Borrelia miyamotoi]WVI05397.1 Mlp family lipoprotein [Borrelia miyamotoi]